LLHRRVVQEQKVSRPFCKRADAGGRPRRLTGIVPPG
jgi:hypothetical protein